MINLNVGVLEKRATSEIGKVTVCTVRDEADH